MSNVADFVYSDSQGILYVVTSDGTLVRWSAATNTFLSPVTLGGQLSSIDISPDGSFLLVTRYTVQPGMGQATTIVDRISTSSMAVTPLSLALGMNGYEGGAIDVSIGANNTALLTTMFNGSGWTPLHRSDVTGFALGTGGVSNQELVRGGSLLLDSEDHRYTLIQESSATTLYDSLTGLVVGRIDFTGWPGVGDISSAGQLIATANPINYLQVTITLRDLSLNAVKTIDRNGTMVTGLQFTGSAHQLLALDGQAHTLYVLDSHTGAQIGSVAVSGNDFVSAGVTANRPIMQLSADGRLLFINNQTGFEVIDLSAHMNLTLTGTSSGDSLWGDVGADSLSGGDGDDVLGGGRGDDTLSGGLGRDTASYDDPSLTTGVTVNLAIAAPQDTIGAGIDTLSSIENLVGSAFADVLIGDAGDNVLTGGRGNDTLTGGGGADVFAYGAFGFGADHILDFSGNDRIDLSGLHIPDLQTLAPFLTDVGGNAVLDFGGASGSIVIENTTVASLTAGSFIFDTSNTPAVVVGTSGADHLFLAAGGGQVSGLDGDDVIRGYTGADLIDGGPGNDLIDGGGGSDTAVYASAPAGVTVSLRISGPQDTGGAGVDTLISIENLKGSAFDDVLIGDASANTIDGGAGIDTTSYAWATSGVTVDLSLSTAQNTGGGGVDTLISIENVIGSDFDDTFMGSATVANRFDGGAGIDTVSYANSPTGVMINLGGPQNAGGGPADTLISIENLIGSAQSDVLTGNAGANVLVGGDGNDFLNGDAGDDVLTGGAGSDTLSGGGGADVFKDTIAGLKFDSITDLGIEDRIVFTDANLANFSFAVNGATLTFTGGSLTLYQMPANYHFVAAAAAGGGVELSLAKNVDAAHDFNGDGRSDLVWRSDSGQFSDWLGQANGGFVGNDANAFMNIPTSWRVNTTGDFNGDGRDDILWRSDSGQMSNWLGQANGGFVSNDANALRTVGTDWHVVGAGDFNGDGKDDILWRSDAGQMSNWLGQANGGFVGNDANAFATVATDWHIVGIGDFNGDGRSDIAWRSDAGQMSTWLAKANGGFTNNDVNAFTTVATDWHIVGTGDFNGDGRSDILWRSDAGQMSNWLGTAAGGFVGNDTNAFTTVPTDWVIAGTGDFNGDGRDDIVWRNSASGAMSTWLGRADGGFTGNDTYAYGVVSTAWHIQADGLFGV